jgi:hypothetical protein
MINDFHQVSHLRVAAGQRYLTDSSGAPFFWMGDTAWTMLQRLDRDETLEYLDNRQAKGFNVLQTMGIMEFDGLRVGAQANGEVPLIDLDPARPNEKYWTHVEWVLTEAARRGMLLALLPTWGDKWNVKSGIGPQIFTPQNAAVYGEWLGRRFREFPLIWVLGGDRSIENEEHLEIMRAFRPSRAPLRNNRIHPLPEIKRGTKHEQFWDATLLIRCCSLAPSLPEATG